MKWLIRIILPLALIGAGVIWMRGQLVPTVPVAEVFRGPAIDAVSGNVTTQALTELTLRTQVEGAVVATLTTPGAPSVEVTSGQEIVRLDERTAELERQRLGIRVDALRRQLEIGPPEALTLANLQQDYESNAVRAERGQYPAAELAKQERDVQRLERIVAQQELAWETELAQLEKQAQQLELQQENMVVRAPFDGLLASVSTVPGDYLFAGDPVARLLSRDLQVRISISEEDFDGVTVGKPVLIRFLGLGNETFRGEVAELLPTADPQARRREVRVIFTDEPGDALVAGMTGEASLIKDRRDHALIIPRRALRGNQVYVLESGRIDIREVEPGFVGLLQAEILSGLDTGDLVVTDRLEELREGQKARAEED